MYTTLAVATTFSWAQATHESNAKTSGDVVDTIEEQNVKPTCSIKAVTILVIPTFL
jgi:hypothetical protein